MKEKTSWEIMKEFFNSSSNYEAKRGRDIYFFSNETDRIGHLVSRSREWDFYLTRMYAQLAFSLKKRHGIILAPYPMMNRLDDEATCLDVKIEE